MAILDVVKDLLGAGEKLTGRAANEANTKALLIEPLLAALGWDPSDPDEVVREWRVYDNTSLDYALLVGGKAALYLEAKAVGKNLDDRQFIAQTVNYANNDGVLWCVLTNGLVYRIYKTNEPVSMEQKLLVELDLREVASRTATDAAASLRLLRREALTDGSLDDWGERVFTDARVRRALAKLAADPRPAFLSEIADAVGKPEIAGSRLKESLARVFDSQIGAAADLAVDVATAPQDARPKRPPSGGTTRGPAPEYPLDHHLEGKPAAIVDIFEQLDEYGRSLGADVTRRIRKQYVGYFRDKRSFFTLETQRQRVLVYLALNPAQAKPWNDGAMRDVRKIGHFGMGDTEYSARSAEQLDEVRSLIKDAYGSS